jgi:hypothetical protein
MNKTLQEIGIFLILILWLSPLDHALLEDGKRDMEASGMHDEVKVLLFSVNKLYCFSTAELLDVRMRVNFSKLIAIITKLIANINSNKGEAKK